MSNIIHLDQYRPRITTSSRARELVERVNAQTFEQVRKGEQAQFETGDRVKHKTYQWEAVVAPDPECLSMGDEVLVAIGFNVMVAELVAIPKRDLMILMKAQREA